MRDRLYQMLVNRVPGIRDRYLEEKTKERDAPRGGAVISPLA
ncbi:MAG: hypothetical protein ACLR23_12195 [Clostridia bacterium]